MAGFSAEHDFRCKRPMAASKLDWLCFIAPNTPTFSHRPTFIPIKKMENETPTTTEASSALNMSLDGSKRNKADTVTSQARTETPGFDSREKSSQHVDSSGDRSVSSEESAAKDLVEWEGPDDPENPQNFSKGQKWAIVFTTGFMTFTVSLSSSIFSTVTTVLASRFGVSERVMTLGMFCADHFLSRVGRRSPYSDD
ncbi:MAG: hypothetical protein Q9227_006462 [Pyrenula ochraceoflavens]